MLSAGPKAPAGSEFDEFLFTPLGEDQNGLPLSVVSLLARLNLDPWQEARNLAELPAELAAKRMADSLDSVADPILRTAITESVVRRALARLPRRLSAAVKRSPASAEAVATPHLGSRVGTIIMITSAIVVLGSQFLTSRRNTSIPPPILHRAGALAVPSQTTNRSETHGLNQGFPSSPE
jgi:hypothetical protein